MHWLGFWMFLSVCVACDAWMFSQGYEGYFFSADTKQEKEIQKLKMRILELEAEKK